MPSRVTVRLTGQIGLDDVDDLRAYLARETGLDWSEESLPDRGHLSGIAETILIAVITNMAAKRADTAVDAIVAQVRAAVRRWRDRWLDPPDIEVLMRDLPGTPETGDPAAPETQKPPETPEAPEATGTPQAPRTPQAPGTPGAPERTSEKAD